MDGFPSRVDGFPSRVDGFPSRVDGFPSSVSCVDGFPSRVDGFPDIWKIFHQDGWISIWGGWISITLRYEPIWADRISQWFQNPNFPIRAVFGPADFKSAVLFFGSTYSENKKCSEIILYLILR